MTRKSLWGAFALLVATGLCAAPVRAQDDNGGAKPTDEKKAPDAPAPDKGDKPAPPPDGGDQQQGRRGRRGGRGGPFSLPVDELKKELGLTDDQVKKLEDLNQEMRDEFRKARQQMQDGGDFDPAKMREAFKKMRDDVREKIRGLLTDDQKAKFAEYTKKEDERMARGPQFGPNPERMKERLLEQAKKELTLAPDEKAAVIPLVQKLLDARADQRVNAEKRRSDLKEFARKAEATTDAQKAEIAAKLADYRKAADEDKKKVQDAQQALREVLTIDNEAKLVAIGILD